VRSVRRKFAGEARICCVLTPQQKGNALERAVRAIETAILSQAPGYDEKTFRVEEKKRIKTKEGVPHEIDIWVTVDAAPGYAATFIFECKNWKKKVGKAEVSAFADKIAATQAQRGFLVAKALTRGALARLKSDQRMELLSVRELAIDEVPTRVRMFYGVYSEIFGREYVINVHGREKKGTTEAIDLKTAVVTISGEDRELDAYLKEWTNEAVKSCPTTEGTHPFQASRVFASGEAMLNGEVVHEMTVAGKVRVSWVPGVIVSRFEVTSRGRVVQCLVECPNGTSVVMQELVLSPKG
jgi:hypothetical protein